MQPGNLVGERLRPLSRLPLEFTQRAEVPKRSGGIGGPRLEFKSNQTPVPSSKLPLILQLPRREIL